MITIGFDQSLSNSALYEHRCLENIKKYTHLLVKVSTNISIRLYWKPPRSPLLKGLPTTVQQMLTHQNIQRIQAQKSLWTDFQIYWIKKTAVHRLSASKKLKAIGTGYVLWLIIPTWIGHAKINAKVNKYLYDWVLHHPQFVQSPISNDCLKFSIDGKTKN